jgi:quinol monooxygenase YgiN
MFARLVRFSFGPGQGDKAEALAAELVPLIGSQPGCQSVSAFGDESDGESGIFVLWDTQEHADAAANVVRPQLGEHLAGHVQAPPEARLLKVLASK